MKLKPSSIALLAIALVLAASSAFVARNLMRTPAPPKTVAAQKEQPKPKPLLVLKASQAIAPGKFIDRSVVRWEKQSESDTHAGDIIAKDASARRALEQNIFGSTVSKTIEAGETILDNMLLYSGSPGFIPAVLSPGMRAITIPTSAVTSNAGLVSAGDWVDVILSVERDGAAMMSSESGGLPQANLAAQTILQKVRVLALNSDTKSLAPAHGALSNGKNDKKAKKNSHKSYETITLEVTPEAAERLAVAREAGSLQVVLRSLQDDDTLVVADTEEDETEENEKKVTRLKDTTAIFVSSQKAGACKVQTFQGNKVGNVSF